MNLSNEEILAAFVRPQAFPAEAIALADARRGEIAPLLIEEIEACAAGHRAGIEGYYYLPDIACHLLAEWRDSRGFKPLLALLSSPDHEMLGDSITESAATLLARLYDGDEAALPALIRNRAADEFVRDAAFGAYVLLAQDGKVPRSEVHAFLHQFFADEPHQTSFVWDGWIDAVAKLQFADLVPMAKQLFEEEAIDITWLEFEDFEDDFAAVRDGWQPANKSPIELMRRWQYVSPEDGDDSPLDDEDIEERIYAAMNAMPATNPYRDIGRNAPCPCGSGKKFKKCCLPKVEAGLP